jgi:hypothetical protein
MAAPAAVLASFAHFVFLLLARVPTLGTRFGSVLGALVMPARIALTLSSENLMSVGVTLVWGQSFKCAYTVFGFTRRNSASSGTVNNL